METINQRIKILRLSPEVSLSQEAFAERIGLKGSAISLMEAGKRNITEAVTKSICREFGVDYLWLTTGNGEMFRQAGDDAAVRLIDRILDGESEFAKMMFKAFAKLDNEDWLKIEQLVKKLLSDVDIEDISRLLSKNENENE